MIRTIQAMEIGVPVKQRKRSVKDMKKQIDELRPEYDLSQLKGGVRGKYSAGARNGTNIILLAPDVAEIFHDDASVNEALRTLIRLHSQKSEQLAA
jgi:hypothetical protein